MAPKLPTFSVSSQIVPAKTPCGMSVSKLADEQVARLNLLKQRMFGNDDVESSSQNRDPMSSNGVTADNYAPKRAKQDISIGVPLTEGKSPLQRPHSLVNVSMLRKESEARKITDEMNARIESERQLRQEAEQKLQKMKEIAVEFIEKYAAAKQEVEWIEILQKEQRLGTVTTQMSGTAKWSGGIDVIRTEAQIAQLRKLLGETKQSGARRANIQKELKDAEQTLKRLEDERKDLCVEMRRHGDQAQSMYKATDLLNEGKYLLLNYLGRGGFSEVWEAVDLENARKVAIKIQRMNQDWSDTVKQNFLRHMAREINIMTSTQHENVVTFYEYFYIGEESVALVMECCEGGDLAHLLRKRGRLPEKEAKRILCEVISGLSALRIKENYVIHYDLKPANILFSQEGAVKIADFGLSKIVECDVTAIELTSQGTGTYYYAAPETFKRGKGVFITPSVDTWSLGIIFYEMLYGQRPFGSEMSQVTFAKQTDQVFSETIQFPPTVKVSDGAKEFIKHCLELDPMRRPKLEQISQTQYCQSQK